MKLSKIYNQAAKYIETGKCSTMCGAIAEAIRPKHISQLYWTFEEMNVYGYSKIRSWLEYFIFEYGAEDVFWIKLRCFNKCNDLGAIYVTDMYITQILRYQILLQASEYCKKMKI